MRLAFYAADLVLSKADAFGLVSTFAAVYIHLSDQVGATVGGWPSVYTPPQKVTAWRSFPCPPSLSPVGFPDLPLFRPVSLIFACSSPYIAAGIYYLLMCMIDSSAFIAPLLLLFLYFFLLCCPHQIGF